MCIFLSLVSYFIEKAMPVEILICMCLFIITFQMTQGTVLFTYCSEIGEDGALGLALFSLMVILTFQSISVLQIMNSPIIGVTGLFDGLAIFQVFACLILVGFLKETKGKSPEDKKSLYQ